MNFLNASPQLERRRNGADFAGFGEEQPDSQPVLEEVIGETAVSGSRLIDHILDGEPDIADNEKHLIRAIN